MPRQPERTESRHDAHGEAARLQSKIDALREELPLDKRLQEHKGELDGWLDVAGVFLADGAFLEARLTLQHVEQEMRAIRRRDAPQDW